MHYVKANLRLPYDSLPGSISVSLVKGPSSMPDLRHGSKRIQTAWQPLKKALSIKPRKLFENGTLRSAELDRSGYTRLPLVIQCEMVNLGLTNHADTKILF